MKRFIASILAAARKFTVWDYTLFKLCLVSLGVALGVWLAPTIQPYIVVVVGIFGASYMALIARLIAHLKEKK